MTTHWTLSQGRRCSTSRAFPSNTIFSRMVIILGVVIFCFFISEFVVADGIKMSKFPRTQPLRQGDQAISNRPVHLDIDRRSVQKVTACSLLCSFRYANSPASRIASAFEIKLGINLLESFPKTTQFDNLQSSSKTFHRTEVALQQLQRGAQSGQYSKPSASMSLFSYGLNWLHVGRTTMYSRNAERCKRYQN